MAIVVEDGTGLANATSLVAFAAVRAYAEGRGVEITDDDDELTIILNKAMDYIKAREDEYSGERYTEIQALPWPRTGQYINNVLIADGAVPQAAKDYQIVVMLTINSGIDLFPTTSERTVKRKKTGPLETEWFDASLQPHTSAIDAAIKPLLGSGGYPLTVRRI